MECDIAVFVTVVLFRISDK